MNYPIVNKELSRLRIYYIIVFYLGVSIFFLSIEYNLFILLTLSVLSVLPITYCNTEYKRNNITQAKFIDNGFEIIHNGQSIFVDSNDFLKIHQILNREIDFKKGLTFLYQLDLKKEYPFGNKLTFKYPLPEKLDEYPKEIEVLNSIIVYNKRITT